MGWLNRLSPETLSLIEPYFIYSWALSAYLKVLWNEITSLRIPIPSKVRSQGFSNFWNDFTKPPPPDAANQPLVGSAALIPPLLATASGLVLDIGPGTGVTIKHYAASNTITKIFGAEPTVGLHASLTKSIDAAGLSGKYQIITANASAASILSGLDAAGELSSGDGPKSGFDTIVCIRVLCSVPYQRQTIRDLHTLLKPGGRLMVVEHVVNPWRTGQGSLLGRLAQMFYMAIGWAYFVGDCEMTRDTQKNLREAVGDRAWADVSLRRHFGWSPLTYIEGTLTKA